MKIKRGFTLIELLVVVSIIALLVSILLPALSRARDQAKRVKCAANLHSIGTGVATYAASYDNRIPESIQMMFIRTGYGSWADNPNLAISPYWTCAMYELDDRTPPHIVTLANNLAPLFDTQIIDNPEVFYCPGLNANSSEPVNGSGDTVQMFTWEAYSHPGETWPAPELPQRRTYGRTRISYNYFPQSGKQFMVPVDVNRLHILGVDVKCPKYTDKFSELSAQYALATDLLYTRNALPHQFNGEAAGINVLFGDTHVSWSQTQEAFDELLTLEEILQTGGTNDSGPFYRCISKLRP